MKNKDEKKEKQLVRAWQQAAQDLGISIQSPFVMTTDDGMQVEFLLLVEHFGSKLGTLIITLDNFDAFELPEKYGYYCSALNTDSYKEYDRADFRDTLEDWRYFGEEKDRPDWYEGIYES